MNTNLMKVTCGNGMKEKVEKGCQWPKGKSNGRDFKNALADSLQKHM